MYHVQLYIYLVLKVVNYVWLCTELLHIDQNWHVVCQINENIWSDTSIDKLFVEGSLVFLS